MNFNFCVVKKLFVFKRKLFFSSQKTLEGLLQPKDGERNKENDSKEEVYKGVGG